MDIDLNDPYIKAQMDYLKFYEDKKKREEDDARLAVQLLSATPSPAVAEKKPAKEESIDADYLLALKLMEEEQADEKRRKQQPQKPVVETDEALARRLFEEEQMAFKKSSSTQSDAEFAKRIVSEEQAKLDKQKQDGEWEQTLEMIRLEAKSESDQQLARVLREKEELEQRLRDAQTYKPDSNVVISLDSIQYPDHWIYQNSPHQAFDVQKGTPEWNRIAARFNEGLPHQKIHRIERNQNKTLWTWFFLKKQELQAKNSSTKGANEQLVFHGSRANAYEIILNEGFDHRVANMGGAIGAGVYFAYSSATSSGYVSGTAQHKKMLFCRVLAGDVGQGKSGIRRPPEKKASWFGSSKTSYYDSVGTEGSVYVVFDNHQCYPEYVIHY